MQDYRKVCTSRLAGIFVVFAAVLMLVAILAVVSVNGPSISAPSSGLAPASSSVIIAQFSFQPSTVNQGSQVNGTVGLSGGTPPYYLWFNNTPPGCSPPSNPETTSSTTFTFQCNPSSTGSYLVHLDVVDSSATVTKASQTASLNVQTGGNGNGNGNNSNNGGNGNTSLSSLLPGGFLEIGIILVLVFMGAIVAIAAGVVAMAVLVPRRLRQLNETLAKSGLPPKEPKPPA
ncbi:MAG: hypothetical protein WB809_00510 [Thermoplasmata archaeon]